MISPLAYVDPSAKLGNNVEIKPFAYIDKNVTIGDNCVIMPYASIMEGTTMGSCNKVYQNALIGAEPQDCHHGPGTRTAVIIGHDNRIRENVVIAGGTDPDTATVIGDGNFLMDKVHICRDAHIHNRCVLGIGVSVAGNCEIFGCAMQSSGAMIQQHVRVGRCWLVQSGWRVQQGVVP